MSESHAGQRHLPELPDFYDHQVQVAYHLLCDDEMPPPPEHWEGFVARRIVAALRAQENDALPERASVRSRAAWDVMRERYRQVNQEGYTPEHDDTCRADGSLAAAAACYAFFDAAPFKYRAPDMWPWDITAWKQGDRRRNLVRAGALILAEIERLDRFADRAALDAEPGKDERQDAPDGQIELDQETGRRWREDSSLQTWFPYTAEEVKRLRAANSTLRAALAEIARSDEIGSGAESVPYGFKARDFALAALQKARDES